MAVRRLYNNERLLQKSFSCVKGLTRLWRSLQGKSGDCWLEAVDVLWVSTGFLVRVIDIAVAPLSVLDFQDPGAVLELVASVEFRVIGRVGVPHFPEDF